MNWVNKLRHQPNEHRKPPNDMWKRGGDPSQPRNSPFTGPKTVPSSLQSHVVVWSQFLKCSVDPYVTGPSTICYFKRICFHIGPRTQCNKINQWLWVFGVPLSLGFVLGLSPRDDFWKQSKWPWNGICFVDIHDTLSPRISLGGCTFH